MRSPPPRAAAAVLLTCLVTAGCLGERRPAGAAHAPPPGPPGGEPAEAAYGSGPRYVEATRGAGLDRITWCGSPSKDHLLESVGAGAAFADLTGDGLDDVFLVNGWRLADRDASGAPRRVLERGRFAFYRNRGDGTFADETERAGLQGGGAWCTGVAAGDVEADGDLDLYVTCFGPNLLYRNRGGGRFEEVGASAGLADPGWGGGAAFFDADLDGDLDLYLANYIEAGLDDVLAARRTLFYKGIEVMVGPFGLPGAPDRFFRNRGDGTFEEAAREAGLEDVALGYGLGVLAADLDADGDLDLYVANDSNPNHLFRNEGGGRFAEIGVVSGTAFSADGAAQAGMGIETADFDGDGHLDLFVTNFADDASTLYHGEGALFFSDVSRETRVAAATYNPLSWGTAAIDFDQDARPDLVIANGHIYPQVDLLGAPGYRQRNLLLLNRGGTFEDATARAGPGLAVAGSFRGLAVGDLEGDRDPDLLLTRIDEPPLLLRLDGTDPARWLAVVPDPSPGPAWPGARIDVSAGGRTQSRVILSGGSFASQSSFGARFALGPARRAEKVTVRFPGGRTLEYLDVPGGTTLKVPVPPPP